MATVCPGGPVTPDEPTTVTADITVTPNVPQPIYSSNGGPNPIVEWPFTDEFCTLTFTATPGNELIVPTTSWVVEWVNPDLSAGTDATANPALAAGFGVAPSSQTQITGPATSGPVVIGSNTLTATIVSGTIRVSMGGGALFGYLPGDPVSNAVIKYEWATPVHQLRHIYQTSGSDQTPTGLTNYQTSAAVAASPTATCLPVNSTTDTTTNFNGSFTGADPGDPSLWEFHYGTTPGGPYPSNTGGVVVTSPSQTVNVFASGLTPGTTYYYVLVVNQSDDSTLVAQSSECSFTTIGPICSAASAVTAHSANLNGTLLGIPAGGYQYRMRYGTVSGGPYGTTLGPFPAPAGGPTPVSQPTGAVLTPSTPYFYIIEVLDPGNVVVSTSPQCNFLTTNAEAASCNPATGITQTGATLNGTLSGLIGPDSYEFQYGTTPGGPYGTTLGPFASANGPVSAPTGALLPGTQYYFRLVVRDVTTAIVATSSECNFITTAPAIRTASCAPGSNLTPTQVTFNGTVGGAIQPGDTYEFHYGTTSGGPYPSTGCLATPAVAGPVSCTVTGLTPGTVYYFVLVVKNVGSSVVATSTPECTGITQAPRFNVTDPPSAVTGSSANLHGRAFDTEPGDTTEFIWGTTPGGPYPNTACPGTPTTLPANPDTAACPIAGLAFSTQYCYRLITRNSLNVVVTTGNEACFTTAAPPPPIVQTDPATAITNNCMTLHGDAALTQPGCTNTFIYGDTPGGPYDHLIAGNPPVSPGGNENFSATICGLGPNHKIYYRAVVTCGPTATQGAEANATTLDGVYYCGALYDPNDCVFVPDNQGGYFNCQQS